jgi:transcriptional regulator with XRE-family HTH domain
MMTVIDGKVKRALASRFMATRRGSRREPSESQIPAPFAAALGARLRQIREESGETATTIAKGCQRVGLQWDRTILTRVEQGQRQVTFAEILLLAAVYSRPLSDLLPRQTVEVGRNKRGAVTATAKALQQSLTEKPYAVGGGWKIAGLEEDLAAAIPRSAGALEMFEARMPGAAGIDILAAAGHAGDETTTKAAKALGAEAIEVATAAQALWGRGLAEERDERTEQLGPTSSIRARQARRGHVTRQLLAELRPAIEANRRGDNKGDADHGQR